MFVADLILELNSVTERRKFFFAKFVVQMICVSIVDNVDISVETVLKRTNWKCSQ